MLAKDAAGSEAAVQRGAIRIVANGRENGPLTVGGTGSTVYAPAWLRAANGSVRQMPSLNSRQAAATRSGLANRS